METRQPKEFEMSGFPKMIGISTRALIYCKVAVKMLESVSKLVHFEIQGAGS